MKLLQRPAHLPIGVDLGYDSIKLLQLERQGDGLSIVAAAMAQVSEADRASPDRVARAIAGLPALMREHGFKGRRVVACVPREVVQIKTLRLPILPHAELLSAIKFEAHELFGGNPEDLSIQFLTAGEVKQGTEPRMEVIVLAVTHSAIGQLLEQFNSAGLTLDALEFEPYASYRGIERFLRRKEDDNVVNVLVDIGGRQTQVVVGRGHDLTFVKTIDIGGKTFADCVARKLVIDPQEAQTLRLRYASRTAGPQNKESVVQAIVDATRQAMDDLAREISLCLRYYSVTFRGQRPAKVLLHGGEALNASLRHSLQTFINIPIELRHPLAGIASKEASGGHCSNYRSEWGVAVGTAMRRVEGTINIIESPAYFGRRDGDASVVEVVDLNALGHSAACAINPRAERAAEAAHV